MTHLTAIQNLRRLTANTFYEILPPDKRRNLLSTLRREMLACVYVFIIARYEPVEGQELINQLLELIKEPHLEKFRDRRVLLARFNGTAYDTHEAGAYALMDTLKELEVEHRLLHWHRHGAKEDYSKLLISARPDRQDLIVEFKRRFSNASKEAKYQNVLIRDRSIIEGTLQHLTSVYTTTYAIRIRV